MNVIAYGIFSSFSLRDLERRPFSGRTIRGRHRDPENEPLHRHADARGEHRGDGRRPGSGA